MKHLLSVLVIFITANTFALSPILLKPGYVVKTNMFAFTRAGYEDVFKMQVEVGAFNDVITELSNIIYKQEFKLTLIEGERKRLARGNAAKDVMVGLSIAGWIAILVVVLKEGLKR